MALGMAGLSPLFLPIAGSPFLGQSPRDTCAANADRRCWRMTGPVEYSKDGYCTGAAQADRAYHVCTAAVALSSTQRQTNRETQQDTAMRQKRVACPWYFAGSQEMRAPQSAKIAG